MTEIFSDLHNLPSLVPHELQLAASLNYSATSKHRNMDAIIEQKTLRSYWMIDFNLGKSNSQPKSSLGSV